MRESLTRSPFAAFSPWTPSARVSWSRVSTSISTRTRPKALSSRRARPSSGPSRLGDGMIGSPHTGDSRDSIAGGLGDGKHRFFATLPALADGNVLPVQCDAYVRRYRSTSCDPALQALPSSPSSPSFCWAAPSRGRTRSRTRAPTSSASPRPAGSGSGTPSPPSRRWAAAPSRRARKGSPVTSRSCGSAARRSSSPTTGSATA